MSFAHWMAWTNIYTDERILVVVQIKMPVCVRSLYEYECERIQYKLWKKIAVLRLLLCIRNGMRGEQRDRCLQSNTAQKKRKREKRKEKRKNNNYIYMYTQFTHTNKAKIVFGPVGTYMAWAHICLLHRIFVSCALYIFCANHRDLCMYCAILVYVVLSSSFALCAVDVTTRFLCLNHKRMNERTNEWSFIRLAFRNSF